ncbi:hypothetical protein [Prosthecobacter sp.]|uniref:hypothetical protein n=1 Tax=Prosthecobacter sp. TaxID=1965333 RepID=UPI003784E994
MNRLIESFLGGLLGPVGAWTVRLLTLNQCKPDPESWGSICLGWGLLVGAIILLGSQGVR